MESSDQECSFKIESRIKFANDVGSFHSPSTSSTFKDNKCLELAETLKTKLKSDVNGCDLLWSLFTSALLSYRRDTLLRPCPPNFSGIINDNGLFDPSQKNFERMKTTASDVPPLTTLLRDGNLEYFCCQSRESAELLLWVLQPKTFSIRFVGRDLMNSIKQQTGQVVETPDPLAIYEIVYNDSMESKFQGKDLIYAYHGSRLENFHSILHNGLRNHMNKNSVYGEGTYLSSELSVCMPYSPYGLGWCHSLLGENLSCIAVCQVIRHPDVKCHTKARKENVSLKRRAKDIVGDGVPEKYYIVRNDELVCIKYLLVYSNRCPTSQQRSLSHVGVQSRSWLMEHKFLVLMMGYIIVLIAVGIGDVKYPKMLYKKLLSWFS